MILMLDEKTDEKMEALAHSVIGAAIEVHTVLGPGFLENMYEEALASELSLRKIPFERQKKIGLYYKGCSIGEHRVDLLVDGQLIVELKVVDSFFPIHTAQVLSYLKATDLKLGLLINFNVTSLKIGIKRVIAKKISVLYQP